MKLHYHFKHIKRTILCFFQKPYWVENVIQIESLVKSHLNFLIQSYFQMGNSSIPATGQGGSLKKTKPSFLAMQLASDPAFPQSSIPVSALVFPISKNWHCKLSQQVQIYLISSTYWRHFPQVNNRHGKLFALECSLLEPPRSEIGDFPLNTTVVYITVSPLPCRYHFQTEKKREITGIKVKEKKKKKKKADEGCFYFWNKGNCCSRKNV